MPKGKTKNNNNQKNILYHNEWTKQLNELKNKYNWTLSQKGICLEDAFSECEMGCMCDNNIRVTNRNEYLDKLKTKIENLKCRCGCN